MDDGGLTGAGQHERGAAPSPQEIARQGVEPGANRRIGCVRLPRHCRENTAGQGAGKWLHITGTHRHSMLGHRAGARQHTLDDVQPIRLVRLASASAPARGEVMQVVHVPGTFGKKIGVERHNDVGLIDSVVRFHGFAKRQQRAAAHIIKADRFMDLPLRLRINLRQAAKQLGQ